MTFPVIASTGTSALAASNSLVVNLPASIATGDLLLIFMQMAGASTTIATPSGWTSLFTDATTSGTAVFYKYASGSEGASVTVTTTGTARVTAAVSYRITGTDGSTSPEIVESVNLSSTTYDPPSLSPSWGSADTLWFAVASPFQTGGPAITVTTAPTSYTLQNAQQGSAATAFVFIYTRTNTTGTEDPSAFTLSRSGNGGRAMTVGVKPGTPAAIGTNMILMF